MKKTINILFGVLFFALTLCSHTAFAQAPQAIPYQAVARDNSGATLANQNISLQVSIHDATATGTIVYQETQTATTSSLGLFNVNIGQGTPITGTLASVDWGNGSKFIQIEFDPTGGTSYTDMGTTQLMSVPYALSSGDNQWTQTGNDIINNNGGNVGVGTTNPNAKFHAKGGMIAESSSSGNIGYSIKAINTAFGFETVGIGFGVAHDISNALINMKGAIAYNRNNSWGRGDLSFLQNSNASSDVPTLADAKMTITNNGNVGIGTTTPESKLDVVGSIKITDGSQGAGKVLTSDANGLASWATMSGIGLGIGSMAGNTPYWNGTSWVTNSSNIFNNGGNVGIGTSSPSARLEILNLTNGTSTPTLRVFQHNCGAACAQSNGSALQLVNSNSTGVNNGARLSFADSINVINNDNGAASIHLVNRNSSLGYGGLAFSTRSNVGLSEKVRIDTNGNVGIGITSPAAKLDVSGDAKINGLTFGTGGGNIFTNTALGFSALVNNTAGDNSVAVGFNSLANNTTGASNMACGYYALFANSTGNENVACGRDVLLGNTTGNGNTGNGFWSLRNNTTGEYNVAIGNNSLTSNATGNLNTAIGANANVASSNLMNATAIGANASVASSNSLVLGNNANVGIGTSTPSSKLDIIGSVKITDGSQGAGKVLTSDANGLASWQRVGATAYGVVSSTGVLGNNYGIASVTRNSIGNYTITLSITPATVATVNATMSDVSGWGFVSAHYVSGNTIQVICRNASSSLQDSNFNIVVYAP